jgi:4-hydroxybenzoate polyprenyltransferase
VLKNIFNTFFFGNFFYGLCVAMLSIETRIQYGLPLQPVSWYIFVCCSTVVFYCFAYRKSSNQPLSNENVRAVWFQQNKQAIRFTQWILIACSIGAGTIYFWYHLQKPDLNMILFATSFPLTAALYYSVFFPKLIPIHIRHAGWLKPFIIGYVWAGIVTTFPLILNQPEVNHVFTPLHGFLFVKNWLFVSVLAILFDIKDFEADNNLELKTFVVRFGLRKTIFLVVIPVTIIGWALIGLLANRLGIPQSRVLINAIPFALLIIAALSLLQRKPILYYLAVIDGLLLVKAICGIIAFTII